MPVQKNSPIPTNRIRFEGNAFSVGALLERFAAQHATRVTPNARVALVSDSGLDLIAAAAWLAHTRHDGLILPTERFSDELRLRLGFNILNISEPNPLHESSGGGLTPNEIPFVAGRVTLLTSGTTGQPKLVEHTWESLFTMGKLHASKPANWLLTYQPGTYAWFQMLSLLLFVPKQDLTLPVDRSPLGLVKAARGAAVTAISSTPTFWRMAFLQVPATELQTLKLQQITLGGEAVDQSILTQLSALFPEANLTHIYASTEAGASLVVNDRKEGFPASWLSADSETTSERPQLQERDGLLWIRSPYAARNRSGWINTGDQIEIRGDRAFILGRKETAFINVGGAKVAAHEVEQVLLQHPAVLWCRVCRTPAPFVGELVGADVVFRNGSGPDPQTMLTRFCSARMDAHMVPRVWNILSSIPVTENLKTKVA
jgi:acyl-coenzyme A synthetase/AMP-(fatty) acid ligase